MSGGVDSSVTAKLLADKVSNMSLVMHQNLIFVLTGLRPISSVHAQLGHTRRVWFRSWMRVGERLGRCQTRMPGARYTL